LALAAALPHDGIVVSLNSAHCSHMARSERLHMLAISMADSYCFAV